jgi:hypothetical protein
MLFFSATFIVPNQDAVTALNGVRVEWLNSFSYFARTGIYLTQGTIPSGSLNFSSNNYLSLSAAQTIGTQAFTFECFFYTASNGLQTILGASATGGMSIWLFGNGVNPVTTIQIDRSYVDAAQYTVSAITINTWHHIAVTRDSSNNMSVFLDGVKATGSASNTANYTGPSGLIGAVAGSAYFFTGYLTQIKLAVGSNYYDPTSTSISVPTAVLTTSANTKLLLTTATSGAYLTDTSETQTVSNISAVTYNTSTPFVVKAGAEMRSISSANVYGTHGIIADGPDTLAYLIGHNFGYIGSGGDSSNDPLLAVQAQEIERLNGGVIYFDTTDHKGDVRVGDIFYVNQETGLIAFDAQSISVFAGGNITLESPTSTTIIDSLGVQTGNIRIYDNSIISLNGPVNIKANYGAGTTYLNTDVGVTGVLTTSGDVTIYGNTYFGDSTFDRISINSYLTQDINPNVTDNLYLGSDTNRWNTLFNTLLDVDGITQISSNTITTLTTDTDLRFIAAGSGIVRVTTSSVRVDNDLTVTNNLTVNGISSVRDLTIVGTTTLVGNLNQTGDTYITGLFANSNTQIVGDSYFQVPDIKIYNNIISNQNVGNDLIFTANGLGGVEIENLTFTDSTITNTWISPTTDAQRSIILTPAGTGNVVVNSTTALKIPIGNNTNKTITSIGNIRYNSSYNRYEGYVPNGLVSFNQLYSSDSSNSVYRTSAARFTSIVQSVSAVLGEYTITVLDSTGLVVGYKAVTGPGVALGARVTSIVGNIITLDLPNIASLTGPITFGDVQLPFTIVSGLQAGQAVSGTGIQVGTVVVSQTSTSVVLSKPITQLLPAGSVLNFGAVNSTFITPELTPGAADNTLRFGVNGTVRGTLTASAFVTNTWNISNVNVSGNVISNLTSENLFLAPASGLTNINNVLFDQNVIINNTSTAFTITGTGQGYVKFNGTGAVVFPFGDTSERRATPELGETRFNNEVGYLEVYNATDWIPALGTSGAASLETIQEAMNLWSIILG